MRICQNDPIGRLLYATTIALKKYLENRLRPYGLTAEQFQVLRSLEEDDGITQSELCEVVLKSPANMTRILDRLEKKKYLQRKDNPDDRRSSLVFLTAGGLQLMETVRAEIADFEDKVTRRLSDQQLQTVKDGLKRIQENVEEMIEEQKDER